MIVRQLLTFNSYTKCLLDLVSAYSRVIVHVLVRAMQVFIPAQAGFYKW
jgi:hypothetical protein